MIKLENITKVFQQGSRTIQALSDVSLHVPAGQIYGVIGSSGAGKSTLIRCVNLLERPTSGRVLVDGQELTALSERQLTQARRQIGMIFQHFNLMNSRTVFGNVALPLELGSLSREAIKQRVTELLELVGLADKRDAWPANLSGGQKQRVAIARALAMNPKVLLCDEITSALDPELVGEVLKVLEQLAAEGMTLILVTHEMNFARDVGDRVVFMHQGRVWEQGSSKTLFAAPQTPELKQFISSVRL
ncbi:MAG TPA: DL-methionine transporter ATP-binding subunit [Pantoea sp.]|nr:DL-methionine transporter ATP-binding subunit [Pantoea sp.]